MTETVLLAARDLAVGYASRHQRRRVLESIHVELDRRQLVCLMGRNGSGKSTLLRTLTGLAAPLAGRVEWQGEDLATLSPRQRARRIGVVLPERLEAPLMSARELVALGRYPHTDWTGRLRPEDHVRVDEALEELGVSHLARRLVAELSDGERQRVLIARAMAQDPTLLVLDEPTAFLDLPGRWDVMAILREVVHAEGSERAVLVSTHDLDTALHFADRLWLVTPEGEIVAGEPQQLVQGGALERTFGQLGTLSRIDRPNKEARLPDPIAAPAPAGRRLPRSPNRH
jgi:iron complex transport system ATP-binding protein